MLKIYKTFSEADEFLKWKMMEIELREKFLVIFYVLRNAQSAI